MKHHGVLAALMLRGIVFMGCCLRLVYRAPFALMAPHPMAVFALRTNFVLMLRQINIGRLAQRVRSLRKELPEG